MTPEESYDYSFMDSLKTRIDSDIRTTWELLQKAYNEQQWYVENVRAIEIKAYEIKNCTEPIPSYKESIAAKETDIIDYKQRQQSLLVDSYYTYWTGAKTTSAGSLIDSNSAPSKSYFNTAATASTSSSINTSAVAAPSAEWTVRDL